jgi:hypothetical protein
MIAAAWLAAPAAMAGNDIVKCIDAEGHVTLTDQPCAPGAATIRLTDERRVQGVERVAAALPAPAPQRHVVSAAELRHPAWRPPVVRAAPLARDVETLQAAHRALMLMHNPRTSLAGLP